jgi:hypothetical protein
MSSTYDPFSGTHEVQLCVHAREREREGEREVLMSKLEEYCLKNYHIVTYKGFA